jgi:hypothetical protein
VWYLPFHKGMVADPLLNLGFLDKPSSVEDHPKPSQPHRCIHHKSRMSRYYDRSRVSNHTSTNVLLPAYARTIRETN